MHQSEVMHAYIWLHCSLVELQMSKGCKKEQVRQCCCFFTAVSLFPFAPLQMRWSPWSRTCPPRSTNCGSNIRVVIRTVGPGRSPSRPPCSCTSSSSSTTNSSTCADRDGWTLFKTTNAILQEVLRFHFLLDPKAENLTPDPDQRSES